MPSVVSVSTSASAAGPKRPRTDVPPPAAAGTGNDDAITQQGEAVTCNVRIRATALGAFTSTSHTSETEYFILYSSPVGGQPRTQQGVRRDGAHGRAIRQGFG
jgi:hypothetical protein